MSQFPMKPKNAFECGRSPAAHRSTRTLGVSNRSSKMKGSCHCGTVSYEISRLESLGHCHCVTCRKTHSAAFATTGRVACENFRWLSGEDKLTAYESSPGKRRFFCSVCGCHIVASRDGSPNVLLRAATLDEDPGLRP